MSANTALLALAGVMESVRSAYINGKSVSYDRDEVTYIVIQAVLEMLAGGTPTSIVVPQTTAAGQNDAAIARFCSQVVVGAPYSGGGGGSLSAFSQTGVLADGSTTAITLGTPFTTSLNQVLCSVRDYSGGDNAAISVRCSNLTKTGFNVTISGGTAASTVTLDYAPAGT